MQTHHRKTQCSTAQRSGCPVTIMKHQINYKYAQRARRRFCKGTCFVAPVDLVLTGKRTLEQWATILSEERDLALEANAVQVNKHFSITRT
jgi:hypothetical protein